MIIATSICFSEQEKLGFNWISQQYTVGCWKTSGLFTVSVTTYVQLKKKVKALHYTQMIH